MVSDSSPVLAPGIDRQSAADSLPRRQPARLRRALAWAAITAQVLFVASTLAAAFWQGPRYSAMAQSISDMSALTAPHASFLVVMFTDCGAATILFALFALRPALRTGGRAATVGGVLLALSVAGLGNLLSSSERLACRTADPGCTAAKALSNTGGKMDSAVTSIGILALVAAGFFLASAMRRTADWRPWAWPTRVTALLILAFTIADVAIGSSTGTGGLFERLIAGTGAAGIAALAIGVQRRPRT